MNMNNIYIYIWNRKYNITLNFISQFGYEKKKKKKKKIQELIPELPLYLTPVETYSLDYSTEC